MNSSLFSIVSIILYLTTTALFAYRLSAERAGGATPPFLSKSVLIGVGLLAILLHGIALSHDLFAAPGLNFGLTNAASLVTWLIATLIVLASISMPLETLSVLVLPSAAFTLLIELIFPSSHMVSAEITDELKFHIIVAIMAYSMLSIAAIQALVVAFQENHLRNKHPGGIMRILPPLQTMESLLFQMIGIGFVLQTAALATGAFYIEDMFARHMVHKTVLSIIAWLVFGILLWGRYYHGWRGRTAIRWTLTGFIIMFLGYFGSKFVIEYLIDA